MLRILKYISVLWLLSNCAAAFATPTATTPPAQLENAVTADSLKPQAPTRGIQFDATADSLLQLQKNAPLFAGFSVSGDLVGVIMAATSSRGQYEGAFRLNLKGKYFPIFEAGFSTCNHTDETTKIHFKTNAPFSALAATIISHATYMPADAFWAA